MRVGMAIAIRDSSKFIKFNYRDIMKATTLSIGGAIAVLGITISSLAINSSHSLAGGSEFAILAASLATAATFIALVYIDFKNVARANQYSLSRHAKRNTAFTSADLARKREVPNEKSATRTASQLDAA